MILPEKFKEVAEFAGLEVYIRGTGDTKGYDYSIMDVLVVSSVYSYLKPIDISDSTIMSHTKRKQARNLHNAYKRHLERQEIENQNPESN